MNEFLTNLKRQAEENPTLALGVGAALIGAIGKLVHASVDARNSRSWAREVHRRSEKDNRK